jgi:hypothetical protein
MSISASFQALSVYFCAKRYATPRTKGLSRDRRRSAYVLPASSFAGQIQELSGIDAPFGLLP